MERASVVCVTGASGFIGSWIVCILLQRGYRVRGTVQNLDDERETEHLRILEGAHKRLELFQVDLLDYDSLATAIGNSEGVFHLASPCFLETPKDPQKDLIEPAVQGTVNVLKAAHAAGVMRVVVTSSISSVIPNPHLPSNVVADESCWSDVEYCQERGAWYSISKVLAERAAWKLAEELHLDVVTINPGCVLGPMLTPGLNSSLRVLINLMKGDPDSQELTWLGCVYVKDVACAQILLYETPSAKGRHLCTQEIFPFNEFAEEVAQMYPQYNVCRFEENTHPRLTCCANPGKKLMSLGLKFTPREEIIRSTVSSLEEKGFLP